MQSLDGPVEFKLETLLKIPEREVVVLRAGLFDLDRAHE
jgi:hypothetical protein